MSGNIPPVLRPEHPVPLAVSSLSDRLGLQLRGSHASIEVTGVTVRSSEIQPGDLFVALPGAAAHGANFVRDAVDRGAVAVLTDEAGASLASEVGVPVLVHPVPRTILGSVSQMVYGTDSSTPRLFGVTGTNGKTSTSYFLAAILQQLGVVYGLSSTAERHIGAERVVSRLTTPEASEMHALVALMAERQVSDAIVEVSAQALTNHRVDGVIFDVVGYTNLSHDHLDDYGTMEAYHQAKLELFTPQHARTAVICIDTVWGERTAADSRIPVTTLSMAGGPAAEWTVTVVSAHVDGTEFRLEHRDGRALQSRIPVLGAHMAANAGLAIVMLVEGGFALEAIASAVGETIDAYLPGRIEKVSPDQGPRVYVDFGHSPDAFLTTLTAVRAVTPPTGRVIMLFGADGDRDATKRHEMGRIASEYSDVVIVTDHHPRFEDPARIRATLLEGARAAEHTAELIEVSPPEKAIVHAVSLAGAEDSILWAGPGHQDYRDIRGERTPYSARELARAALAAAGWTQ